MKQSLSFLTLVLCAGSLGLLTACSQPTPEGGVGSDASSSVEAEGSDESGAIATDVSANLANLSDQQLAYLDEVEAELDTIEQTIQEIAAQDAQPDKFRRLVKRHETARSTFATLQATDPSEWPDARREMRRSMRRLNRVYEKVQGS